MIQTNVLNDLLHFSENTYRIGHTYLTHRNLIAVEELLSSITSCDEPLIENQILTECRTYKKKRRENWASAIRNLSIQIQTTSTKSGIHNENKHSVIIYLTNII